MIVCVVPNIFLIGSVFFKVFQADAKAFGDLRWDWVHSVFLEEKGVGEQSELTSATVHQ